MCLDPCIELFVTPRLANFGIEQGHARRAKFLAQTFDALCTRTVPLGDFGIRQRRSAFTFVGAQQYLAVLDMLGFPSAGLCPIQQVNSFGWGQVNSVLCHDLNRFCSTQKYTKDKLRFTDQYNLCHEVRTLKEPLFEEKDMAAVPKLTQKWRHRTPMMAAKITDHTWTVKELLLTLPIVKPVNS